MLNCHPTTADLELQNGENLQLQRRLRLSDGDRQREAENQNRPQFHPEIVPTRASQRKHKVIAHVRVRQP